MKAADEFLAEKFRLDRHPDSEPAIYLSDFCDWHTLTAVANGVLIDPDDICLNWALHAKESSGRHWFEIEFDDAHADTRILEPDDPLILRIPRRLGRGPDRRKRRAKRLRGLLGVLYEKGTQ